MTTSIKLCDLPTLVGSSPESSEWMEITQKRVNRFAAATNDYQFIHTDPEKAAQTPFGGTIAHGFLTQALLPFLMSKTTWDVEDSSTMARTRSGFCSRYVSAKGSGHNRPCWK